MGSDDGLADTVDAAHAATVASGPPRPGPGELAVGAELGRYRVVAFLGRGGMGAVYLATDGALGGKRVALKIVANGASIDRLRDEVVLAQKVTHRHACRIDDLEEVGDRWMIKMEYIAGESLATRLDRGRLPVAEALAIARQILDGLGAAHAQGVVHRDLKPGNVMIEEGTGRVVLMDFGIARTVQAGDATGEIAGTPAYMAPEQVRARAVDGRADLYALGCVLYQMLTGDLVFPAATPMAMGLRHVEDAPPEAPGAPPWLSSAIRTLLAKAPDDRPRDAAAAAALLAGPRQRRWWIVPAIVGVAAAAITPVVFLATRPTPTPAPTWRAEIVPLLPTYDENTDATRISPDGRSIAYASDRKRLGWFQLFVGPLEGGEAKALTPEDDSIRDVRWTKDGTALLYGRNGEAYRIPRDGGVPVRVAVEPGEPCGDGFVTTDNDAIRWHGPDGSTRVLVELDVLDNIDGPRCDPAGARFVYARSHGVSGLAAPTDLYLIDLPDGAPRALTHDHRHNTAPTFTPDGKRLVFSSARGGRTNLWEMALPDGEPVQLTFGQEDEVGAEITPDGTRLLFAVDSSAHPVFAWHPGDADARRVTLTRLDIKELQLSPDGTELVALDESDGTNRVIAIALPGGEDTLIAAGAHADYAVEPGQIVYVPTATPDTVVARRRDDGTERTIATVDGEIARLAVGGDGVIHLQVIRGHALEAWRVSPDGVAARELEGERGVRALAPDGTWYVRVDGFHFARVEIATGAVTPLLDLPVVIGFAIANDGTLYFSQPVGRARRQLMTNFGERPWAK